METTTPGYKTVAFWLQLLTTLGAAVVAGGTDLGSAASAVSLVLAGLTAAGYAAYRAFKKSDDPAKPSWKTTEFWLSIAAAAVSVLYASGVLSDGSNADKAIGFVAMILAALGYGVTKAKK